MGLNPLDGLTRFKVAVLPLKPEVRLYMQSGLVLNVSANQMSVNVNLVPDHAFVSTSFYFQFQRCRIYCLHHNFRVQIFSRFWTRCRNLRGLNFMILRMFSLL